ncbi:MAG: cation:proton antiporter [Longimicrobiales bacterium]
MALAGAWLGSPAAAAAGAETAVLFVELGAVLVALGLVARLSRKLGLSPIPMYLLLGLAIGGTGVLPVELSADFIETGAEIGVILLLFMIGLEFTAEELRESLSTGLPSGLVDLVLNFPPGVIVGLLLGWSWPAAVLMGGVTYISSSGVIAKVLADLERMGNLETPSVLTILVLEDLAMAVYLPLTAVMLVGGGVTDSLISLAVALMTAALVLLISLRYGRWVSRLISSHSEEVVLLSVLGLIFVVAGTAQSLQVSAAVGAFLVGIALSGDVAHMTRRLLTPLRDLFAALFFLFFGLQIDSAALPPALAVAAVLAVATSLTKYATGWWAARRDGVGGPGRTRAGVVLIARGEFSIVIAEIGVVAGVEPQLGPLAAAYVLLLAVAGPVLSKVVDPLVASVLARRAAAGHI